ncbi:protein ImuB [Litorivivens lipolytica]|uniref:Protein ImuB n=1 Tax=Litorivivens lipolytica TaxID=1524264 RepID=A0A7W4W371_9GAMM|nr:DNA polymerase Y family protein [Litorivivens lipolytica]MBB3046616.1 protein ImuB [Litorivivens lipolytica]
MWLCIRFPRLLLDQPLPPEPPLSGPQALLRNNQIEEVNRSAAAAGVQAGQSLSTARSLCPELQCRTPDPERMQQRLSQLAFWGYRFTPEVSLAAPDCLLLNIRGSLKLFAGFHPLYRRLRSGFRKRRIAARYGLGHTPLAATLLSHHVHELTDLLDNNGQLNESAVIALLDQLPSQFLPIEPKQQERLLTLGLNTLKDVRNLPSTALSRRFGKQFGQLLARLYGEQADPRPYFQPPDTFFSERQFNGELTRSEELRFPLAGLLDELGHFLQLKQWVCRELRWHFCYCDGQHDELQLPVSHAHFDRRQLLTLVLLKLEHYSLRGPVDSLALHCARFETVQQRSHELFPQASLFDHERHARYLALLDKLKARLGNSALWQPVLSSRHLPEQSTTRSSTAKPADTIFPQRPLWLLPHPLRLQEQQQQPYWQGPLTLLQGPERLDNLWWQQRQVRDYYIARTNHNALCWVYRDCLQQRWYLHGWFS